MPECTNPLWPCAMTGAAACLAGFDGITVVIHGSSGCYYYPATLLHAPLSGTFLLEQEVIFGSESRLAEVLDDLVQGGRQVAVITTCVPAAIGEDIRPMLADRGIILVDSPGFSGQFEAGYKKALSVIQPSVDPAADGITIDGISLFDPFHAGNVLELTRMLAGANVPVNTVLCLDKFSRLKQCSPLTVTADRDLAAGIGTPLGGALGFDTLTKTLQRIGDRIDTSVTDPAFFEISRAEERLVAACDKYLRRFDPPVASVFSGFSYATFAAGCLEKYLDADIACIGSRNEPAGPCLWPVTKECSLDGVETLIRKHRPDLVIGSSFERSVRGSAAFVGLTPPLRGKVRLSSRPLAGTEGTLSFMEEVLNACMDRQSSAR